MAHRYFIQDIQGGTARITGQDAHHLGRVLRAKPGLQLVLCDGAGMDYCGTIISIDEGEVLCQLDDGAPSQAEPALWTDVFIGMAKGERMDYAVQKAVELGAGAIRPFYSQNCVVKPKNDAAKTQRFLRIAHEAAKQCGRGRLPQVYEPMAFSAVLQTASQCDRALFFYEQGGLPLRKALNGGETRVALITGPEGGFDAAEAEAAAQAGCVTVGLGPRILRCETAPAVALAVVMAMSGNLE